jgi:hypothetical protein
MKPTQRWSLPIVLQTCVFCSNRAQAKRLARGKEADSTLQLVRVEKSSSP